MSHRQATAVVCLVFALAFTWVLLAAKVAVAHTSYCGHYWKEWTVALPNGFVRYTEVYINGSGSGPHFHTYRTSRRNANGTWTVVDWHYNRNCPSHPV